MNTVESEFPVRTPEQYFDALSSSVIAHIEESPNPLVAALLARCLVDVARNLFR